MKKWKVLVLLGVLLPLISLLFIDNWVSQMGVVWNLGNSAIKIKITDSECLKSSPSILSRTLAGLPDCEKTLLSVRYKWVLLLGMGLSVYGFFLKEKDKGT